MKIVEMAAGAVPASFMGLKSRDSSLSFAKSLDFVRVSDLNRVKFNTTRISVIRNSNPSTDIAELQPASEGSPLLGKSSRPSLSFIRLMSSKL